MKRAKFVLRAAVLFLTAYAACAWSDELKVTLTGAQEIPPVTTSATAIGIITIGADKSVSGTVTTTGIEGTAAHIHEGAPDKYGPVIVPMVKSGDNVWSFPPGAKFTDAQYESYKAGNTFVNVHSVANKGGEIRAQLKP